MRTEWEFSNEDGKLDRQYGEEPFKKGIAGNYTPRTEEETPVEGKLSTSCGGQVMRVTTDSPIPDTDLVRIAEREVLQAAKIFVKHWTNRDAAQYRTGDNLVAAVALLESRESLVRVEGETK